MSLLWLFWLHSIIRKILFLKSGMGGRTKQTAFVNLGKLFFFGNLVFYNCVIWLLIISLSVIKWDLHEETYKYYTEWVLAFHHHHHNINVVSCVICIPGKTCKPNPRGNEFAAPYRCFLYSVLACSTSSMSIFQLEYALGFSDDCYVISENLELYFHIFIK